jgi:hypothetical protein
VVRRWRTFQALELVAAILALGQVSDGHGLAVGICCGLSRGHYLWDYRGEIFEMTDTRSNKPGCTEPRRASQFQVGRQWRGVGDPGRWASGE